MSSITEPSGNSGSAPFFSKQATIAKPGFSRWMVPPAALASFTFVSARRTPSPCFNGPLYESHRHHVNPLPTTWSLTSLGWDLFAGDPCASGLSAAFAGKWLEHVGPAAAMFTAAGCFGGGFLVSALGVHLHQIALLYLGYGVIVAGSRTRSWLRLAGCVDR